MNSLRSSSQSLANLIGRGRAILFALSVALLTSAYVANLLGADLSVRGAFLMLPWLTLDPLVDRGAANDVEGSRTWRAICRAGLGVTAVIGLLDGLALHPSKAAVLGCGLIVAIVAFMAIWDFAHRAESKDAGPSRTRRSGV